MKVLITGADGFIGKNLLQFLAERQDVEVVCFTRADTLANLPSLVAGIDFVFHLAGVNRPRDPLEFQIGNEGLTSSLLVALKNEMQNSGTKIPIIYTSSSQATIDTLYGVSKRGTESILTAFARTHDTTVFIFRLPNVFGKWCRPNYNSVVATFCYNISRGLPIQINDADAALTLVYIDDVIKHFIDLMDGAKPMSDPEGFATITPHYITTVGKLARLIDGFRSSRSTLIIDRVGTNLVRSLYSTYVSYLPPESFSYKVPMYGDSRGTFVEMLKTKDSGQFSFFTAYPGVTRGGHYHHTKTEKFLVIKGNALFNFRHIQTGETYALETNSTTPEIVETVPGWTHDITNIGNDELVVMLWANESFDRQNPDTFACPV
jgi:UDP-2-acetamido-2,6-beta-L-arabino-hexul-4-ose reductase